MLARRPCDDDLLHDQAVGDVHLVRRVVDADVDGVLGRPTVAPLLQPHRQPRAAPGRVDDEVGVHRARFVPGFE